ncbi:MAG: LacI family DNA-binding transcriptional regulator, partial [Tannerella sp.]|nr:LacI family DNA-binding transcriptional regulator [Tannerella sp.]
MKRTSIKDIAQAVGVSNATVSLVLTGKSKNGRVREEIAEKIRDAAGKMNYRPNKLARSLKSG